MTRSAMAPARSNDMGETMAPSAPEVPAKAAGFGQGYFPGLPRPTHYRKARETIESQEIHPFGQTDARPYGLVDSKRRSIGARITRITVVVTEEPQPEPYGPGGRYVVTHHSAKLEIGTHPAVRVHQVRGRCAVAPMEWIDYGSTYGRRTFASEAEREKYIAKYLRDAERRARKAVGE